MIFCTVTLFAPFVASHGIAKEVETVMKTRLSQFQVELRAVTTFCNMEVDCSICTAVVEPAATKAETG